MTKTLSARPRVALHFAQSLDGRIALSGARAHLSSREGSELAHRARAEHDAVLVGSGTLRVDDPCLTVRLCPGDHPRRVVLASTLQVDLSARVLLPGARVLVVGVVGRAQERDAESLRARGAEVRLVAGDAEGLVSLPLALAQIREWGVQTLLVEGGARILSSFLRERLADEVTIEIAPRLLGAPGLSAFGAIGVDTVECAPTLKDLRFEHAGSSIVIRGSVVY